MATKREDGPLLAVMGSLILGILGGAAPPLSKVKTWHLVWLWRMSPGVSVSSKNGDENKSFPNLRSDLLLQTWFTEIWFTQNVAPLDYLYITDLAADATGFSFNHVALDMGYGPHKYPHN